MLSGDADFQADGLDSLAEKPSQVSTGSSAAASIKRRVPEPFRGFKRAFVVQKDGQYMFAPLRNPQAGCYLASATAKCRTDHPDEKPVPTSECSCGFYAVASPNELDDRIGLTVAHSVFLTVDLSGRVLEYKSGFRASHQEVMGVHYGSHCGLCPALSVTLGTVLAQTPPDTYAVIPLCAKHKQRAQTLLTPSDLASKLTCDVTCDRDEPPSRTRFKTLRWAAGVFLLVAALAVMFPGFRLTAISAVGALLVFVSTAMSPRLYGSLHIKDWSHRLAHPLFAVGVLLFSSGMLVQVTSTTLESEKARSASLRADVITALHSPKDSKLLSSSDVNTTAWSAANSALSVPGVLAVNVADVSKESFRLAVFTDSPSSNCLVVSASVPVSKSTVSVSDTAVTATPVDCLTFASTTR